MMTTKHKKHTEKEVKSFDNYKWWIIGGILLVFILINLGGKNNSLLQSIFNKFIPTPTPTPTVPAKILPAEGLNTDQANYVELAIESLADKLKIKNEDIKVLNVQNTKWNDGSLGCPEKGKLYIQAITSGYAIELSAKGKKYYYNGGSNRVVSC